MSESEGASPSGGAKAVGVPLPRHWRLGIAPRLGFAFLGVTVLAIAANLIAEHGISIIETTRLTVRDARVAAAPTPRPAQPKAPTRAASSTGAASLLAALDGIDRAIRARAEANNEATIAELDGAERALGDSTALFAQATSADGAPSGTGLSRQVGSYRGAATVAVSLADARRDLLNLYHQRLDSLTDGVKAAIDHSWKLFGRVLARQDLVAVSRDLEALRQASAALTTGDEAGLKALVASESALDRTLTQNAASLKRSQGAPWEARLRADVGDLVAQRDAIGVAGEDARTALARVATERAALEEFVRTSSNAARAAHARLTAAVAPPAPAPPPVVAPPAPPSRLVDVATATTPDPAAARADAAQNRRWVEWVTAIVLLSMLVTCVTTILSIVRPVRRLVEATRRLSRGGTALVERGGIKELDGLAVAFNDMARQLASAREATEAQKAMLEEKVEERTQALRHLAEHDSLTQLPNRRDLFARLTVALAEAAESGRRVGVYFLDLDNFKNVNDGMGHVFGDRVLQAVAERLRSTTEPFGFAARLGGDEFTLVYPSATSAETISEAGWAICRAFQQPLKVGERHLKMSVSVGIGVYPDHGQTPDELLRAADAALFRAKALGRSQLSVFSPDLLESAMAKFSIEQGLRQAIERREFELAFQPEVSLDSRTPTLVEALLRWRTPTGELLAPGAFLSVAEESGLVLEINEWVLHEVMETAARWHAGDWPAVKIAINVSSRQLLEPEFVERVVGLLREHALPASCIELELTETVLQTGPATIEVLRRLRSHGISIALDDFGTGYSSLSSLELLPLTRVKLDRSLIDSIDSSSVSRAIAHAIIGLCRNLDLEVTAEGVERAEQLNILSGHRAMHVQGFLLSRPAPADRVLTELRALPERMRALMPDAGKPSFDDASLQVIGAGGLQKRIARN